jgi:hypothetical protein
LQLVVGFVDGVEQVQGDDEDVDAPAVLDVCRAAGPGFGVAGSDGYAVVDSLDPAGNKLLCRGEGLLLVYLPAAEGGGAVGRWAAYVGKKAPAD